MASFCRPIGVSDVLTQPSCKAFLGQSISSLIIPKVGKQFLRWVLCVQHGWPTCNVSHPCSLHREDSVAYQVKKVCSFFFEYCRNERKVQSGSFTTAVASTRLTKYSQQGLTERAVSEDTFVAKVIFATASWSGAESDLIFLRRC